MHIKGFSILLWREKLLVKRNGVENEKYADTWSRAWLLLFWIKTEHGRSWMSKEERW